MEDRYLRPTALLDFGSPRLRELLARHNWEALPEQERIGAVYDFVREEIPFGYNSSDDLPASTVLADGYGQCNTKTTLLMALLRGSGIGCRSHGATIDKKLQHGVMVRPLYWFAPASILHTWAEVFVGGRWVGLEGVILDGPYLSGVRAHAGCSGPFLGYGVGTDNLADPPVEWHGTDTLIQATGVSQDFGVYDDPDSFYRAHGVNARGIKGWLYSQVMRYQACARSTGPTRSATLLLACRYSSTSRASRARTSARACAIRARACDGQRAGPPGSCRDRHTVRLESWLPTTDLRPRR